MRYVIELKDVWKTYKMDEVEVNALSGVSLQVEEGEFLALLGPSGSGKSTLMNLVGSLDIPTKGSIFLDGINISHLSESDLAQLRGRKIGFVFQTFNLVPSLSAVMNVSLPMIFQGVTKQRREELAKELLTKVQLAHRMHHKPGQLSGGERQRVAIARSLANNPEVILADEPTGNLDSKNGEDILKLLNELNTEGKTIILVTHDVSLTQYSDRFCMLKDGQIIKTIINKKVKRK